jgi:hypothetical protein
MGRGSQLRRLFLAFALAAQPLSAAGDRAADEVLDCVQRSLPPETVSQMLEFQSTDRAGGGRTIRSSMQWRRSDDGRSKLLLRVKDPPDLKDAGLLLLEQEQRTDMFVYLPDLGRSRRVTSAMVSGSLFGSDFTYEDFTRLQGMALEGTSERLADEVLDGMAVHVIVHHPAEGSGSSYTRVKSFVASQTCVPLRTEMYEEGDRLRKVMKTDPADIHEEKGARVPRRVLLTDLRDKSTTQLVVSEIEVGREIRENVFTIPHLERPRAH